METMRCRDIFALISSTGLGATGCLLPAAEAQTGQSEDRASCVGVRERPAGGQELYNGCTDTLTIFWCVDEPPYACNEYTSRVTNFGPRSTYPVPRGYVRRGACLGANADVTIRSLDYFCAPPARTSPTSKARLTGCPSLDDFYPPASRRIGEAGSVVATVNYGPDGVVSAVSIEQSSGIPRLDNAALSYFRACTIEVTLDDAGAPIPGALMARVTFTLE